MSRTGLFVVSGAGSGIGQATALRIAKAGHHVFGLGRAPAKLQATAEHIEKEDGSFSFLSADLSRTEDSERALKAIREYMLQKRLPLLGLINNAGVFDRLAFAETSDEIWMRQFESNLMSAVRLTRGLYPELKSSKPSSVLNISSTLGLRPVAQTSAYSALKAAMVNWTKTLALEWAGDGIRVNCICPGLVDTPIHSFHGQADSSENRKAAHQAQPLGRMGTSQNIAESAWFLASELSEWTTGTILSVDGGISL
jgi:NAD(P)-dependent dehydrogenase (short-subunit alcohol dehydrogenase family)